MAPRLPRRVPWTSIAELEQLCSWIFTDENDLDAKVMAVQKISAWKTITSLPHAIDATFSLLVVIIEDKMPKQSSFSFSLRQNYAAAIIRLVNGLVDPLQSGAYARSIASISDQLGLPLWLVELRHAATHEDLPSLELLQEGARQSMVWLFQNYWLPAISPYTAPKTSPTLRSLAPVLKEYKRLLKATTRDHSLKSVHQQSITKVVREVERWLGEAKVAADLEWKGGDNDSKENFALEKLSDELLQKGILVPLSKKKRIFPSDTFHPPPNAVDIWSPLILQMHALHPDFCSVLVERMMTLLLSDSVLVDEGTRSATYDACVARWAMWVVESCQTGNPESNMKRETIVSLISALGPKMPSSKAVVMQFLQALCAGEEQYETALTYLSSQDTHSTAWQSDDISVMVKRLEELLSSTVDEVAGVDTTDSISMSVDMPGDVLPPGWTLLDNSRWKPCPLGVHSVA
ncbi:Las1-domain-containing protein [Hymenopellis radicata]|nr:Las1-domain-containing protein [Hymenopellis radicata]